jgi:hyperosmotically inducible protein
VFFTAQSNTFQTLKFTPHWHRPQTLQWIRYNPIDWKVQMMKFKRTIGSAAVITALLATLSACHQEGPAEKAGQKIDKAVEKTGEKINQTTGKIGEKLEKTGEKIQDSVKRDEKK